MSDKVLVKCSDIESQLVKLWEEMESKSRTRACLFNLILYVKKGDRGGYLEDVAKNVAQKFPCRIILMDECDSVKDGLEASVSVLAVGEGDNQIFCDMIHISFSSENRKRAPYTLLPHLLPDLPIYLVWGDDPVKEDPLSFNLEQFAHRTIFDSEASDNLASFAKAISHHQEASHSDIADLNWARIEGWRNLFASIFYNESRLTWLGTASRIEINYNHTKSDFYCHTKIQSLYFQAWIANQLGWQFDSIKETNDQYELNYTSSNGSVQILLKPTETDQVNPGGIMSIDLQNQDNTSYKFQRKDKQPHLVQIQQCEGETCKISGQHYFEKEESGQSLVNEIYHQGTSKHYLAALKTLETYNQELPC